MKLATLAVAIGLFSACTKEEIVEGVCGNGIVEPGEDCDAPGDARCEACAITCGDGEEFGLDGEPVFVTCESYHDDRPEADGSVGGTVGFICGPDKKCHAASGIFDENSNPLEIPAAGFQVTNVDGDQKEGGDLDNELLVQSQTAIISVKGASRAETEVPSVIQTPIARGHAAFAYLDSDSSLDVLLPTVDGIVAYTSQFGSPSPAPFPSPVTADQGTPLLVRAITPQHLGILVADQNEALLYIVLDVAQRPPLELGRKDLCGATLNDLRLVGNQRSTDDFEVFDLPGQHQIVVLSMRADGVQRLCVLTNDFKGVNYAIDELSSPSLANVVPKSRPVLANLRNQVCPSLVLAQGSDAEVVEYPPSTPDPPCSFDPAAGFLQVPAGAVPIGSVVLEPPIAGAGLVALALSSGIHSVTGNVLGDLYRSDRPLARVQSIDIDRDNDRDVIAIGERVDDIDILDRHADGFLRFRFDTAGAVSTFVLGDFDGDERPDIGFVEVRNGDGAHQLAIAYGTADQLLPGVTVGRFQEVLSVIPTQILDSTDPFGLITDLAVLFQDPNLGRSALTLLHGSPQRTMLAFFDPRFAAGPESQFRGVVAGKFSALSTQSNDVIAIEQDRLAVTAYLSPGATGSELEPLTVASGANLLFRACDLIDDTLDPTASGTFCVADARYVAWPDVDHDVVLGIDSKHELIWFDPAKMRNNEGLTATDGGSFPNSIAPPNGAVVRKFRRIDIDGAPRLLISLGTPLDLTSSDSAGAAYLCTFDKTTGLDCLDIGAAMSDFALANGGPEITCIDAGVGRFERVRRFEPPAKLSPDLVVLCYPTGEFFNAKLLRVSLEFLLDPVDPLADEPVPLIENLFFFAETFEVGDVSGDGIDDIVLKDSMQGLVIHTQCTSRDLGCGQFKETPPFEGMK
jgi:hypothetical protein